MLGTFCPLSNRVCFQSVKLVTVNSFTIHRIMFPLCKGFAWFGSKDWCWFQQRRGQCLVVFRTCGSWEMSWDWPQQNETKQINNRGTGRSEYLMNVIMERRMLTTKIFMHHWVIAVHCLNILFGVLLGSKTMKTLKYILKSFNCVDRKTKKRGILF